jgi:hypothetical protein
MEKPYQLSAHSFAVVDSVAGFDTHRRGNTKLLSSEPPTLGYVAGNAVRIHDVRGGSIRTLFAQSGFGVGAFALHPAGDVLAVAEKGVEGQAPPVIQLYSFPGLRRLCSLDNGTDRSYADVNFRSVLQPCALGCLGSERAARLAEPASAL